MSFSFYYNDLEITGVESINISDITIILTRKIIKCRLRNRERKSGKKLTIAMSTYSGNIKFGGTFFIREIFSKRGHWREEIHRVVLRMRRVAYVKGKETDEWVHVLRRKIKSTTEG